MKLESPRVPNKIEKEDEILEQVKQDLIKRVANLPEDEQEVEIYRILNTEYGLNLKKEIPKSKIIEEKKAKENTKETEQEKTLKEIALKLEKRLADIPDSAKGVELERILREEYGVSLQKIEEIKKSKNWTSKLLHYGTIAGLLGLAFFSTNIINNDIETTNKEKKELKFKENKKVEKVYKMDSIKMPKFDIEVYNSLSNEGKEVYKYYSEKNPTPGKGYIFLDKKNATLYAFDAENNLLEQIIAGFGTEEGDEHNTSAEYKKGTRTTPAGIYIISNLSDPRDILEYGENHLSLFGISTLGNKEFLGLHQTYEGNNEKTRREKRLATINPSDNRFSDGCINIDEKDFEKYIKENFQGQGDELLFVFPDKKASAEFETEKLISQIKPVIEEMKKRLKEYNEKQSL